MILLNREFKPSIVMTLLTLCGVILFTSLGLWQLERAGYKQDILSRFEARLDAEYTEFNELDLRHDLQYKKVILRGGYDFQRSMLLDNQVNSGRVGYHVISPFVLDSGSIMLVNRGWVAVGESRQSLPVITRQEHVDEIRGILVTPMQGGFRLGDIQLDDVWPRVLPFIDIERMQPIFSGRLLPVIMWLSPQQEDVYERNWQPVWQAPEKSEAYALQWFSFAVIAVVLFVFLNLRKLDERRSRD